MLIKIWTNAFFSIFFSIDDSIRYPALKYRKAFGHSRKTMMLQESPRAAGRKNAEEDSMPEEESSD